MIRVAIIDDHAIVRMGLKYSLSLEPDFEFAGEHSGGEGAGEFVARVRPDVVLLDVRMPVVNGIEALEDIRRKAPDVKVLMLTTSDGDEDVFRSMNMGARGYMVKDESGEDLHVAIRTVASGKVFLPKRIKAIYDDRKKRPSLSEREIEIIRLVAKGFSNASSSCLREAWRRVSRRSRYRGDAHRPCRSAVVRRGMRPRTPARASASRTACRPGDMKASGWVSA